MSETTDKVMRKIAAMEADGWDMADFRAALAERDKRIGELEEVNDSLQDRLWLANVKIGELTAELNETTECCNCHIALEAANVKLTAEVGRLQDSGEALRDYLNNGTWPDFDIPDEIWGPFEAALGRARHRPHRLAARRGGESCRLNRNGSS